ncbi:hypothetical protein NQ314_000181 [Rhamnusium bicolor]|uniref:Uncharacterized protein n=1 Tax=Rhamnusium bicolor TaxID=1586634 RepID=A0AAV8ZYZ3_9CUCU|nr:hypothetical protein NQ314_000181 [Rhamnusium bicolor]
MTETRIFEILLRNHKNEDYNFDYPKLQEEAVNIASKTFTDIIYNTLKQKSLASSIKRGKCLEVIKQMDQEKLDLKFNIQVRRNFSYYETNETLIRNLLNDDKQLENKPVINKIETTEFREKQVKLAYALINIKNKEDIYLIEKILIRMSRYAKLEEFEVNFLQYVFTLEDETIIPTDLIFEKFPFLLERLILKYSANILCLNEEIDVDLYFINLEDDKKIAKIRTLCKQNTLIHHKLRSLIYELYCYSFCNVNVLKLLDFIK